MEVSARLPRDNSVIICTRKESNKSPSPRPALPIHRISFFSGIAALARTYPGKKVNGSLDLALVLRLLTMNKFTLA